MSEHIATDIVEVTPTFEEIEKLARRLCEAEGIDPDARTTWHAMAQLATSAGKITFIPGETPLNPAWHHFRHQADVALKLALEIAVARRKK